MSQHLKAHSHEVHLMCAATAELCVAAKKRKSSYFFHRTCLPHPHAPNPRRVNGPLGFHLGHFTDTVTMHFGVRRSSRDLSILLLQNVYKTLKVLAYSSLAGTKMYAYSVYSRVLYL